jgi:2-oxoisovalerate dehydrogenase E1 component alpha subunit
VATTSQASKAPADPYLKIGKDRLLDIHRLMVRARILEEQLIKMSKSGEGFFWIGGPGEEAFNVPLGLQVLKGSGVSHDYLHLHYRSSALLLAMGAPMIDFIRQMRAAATDPYSHGRNFVNHVNVPEWNVVPMCPTIEVQYSMAIGTAIAQARAGGRGVTIVNGGDAGSAEGDFHTCLVWSNRPVLPLPVLMVVVNNGFGISTPASGQHGEKHIADWTKAFDMPGKTIDGNDPVASYFAISEALDYCRSQRRPYLIEALTSRLYGHSSSSGANRISGEADCIALFEEQLMKRGLAAQEAVDAVWQAARAECQDAYQKSKSEPQPRPEDIWPGMFSSGLPDSYPTKGGS